MGVSQLALEKELETYKNRLDELLDQEGKFVVIYQDDVIGIYSDYEDALNVGYEKCGTTPFLVKKIEAIETINYFTRDLPQQCHT